MGAEPSGEAFNAIRLDPVTGRPPNPMVNAGALLTTSLVRAGDPVERFERIRVVLSAFAGRDLAVDETLYASELGSASRNRALAYLMQSAGSLRADVEHTIDVYCRQCSVAVTAADLAVMAGTLANGGVNPVTGVRGRRGVRGRARAERHGHLRDVRLLRRVAAPRRAAREERRRRRADRREPGGVRDRRLQPAPRRARKHGAWRRRRERAVGALRPAPHAPSRAHRARRLHGHERGCRRRPARSRSSRRRGTSSSPPPSACSGRSTRPSATPRRSRRSCCSTCTASRACIASPSACSTPGSRHVAERGVAVGARSPAAPRRDARRRDAASTRATRPSHGAACPRAEVETCAGFRVASDSGPSLLRCSQSERRPSSAPRIGAALSGACRSVARIPPRGDGAVAYGYPRRAPASCPGRFRRTRN